MSQELLEPQELQESQESQEQQELQELQKSQELQELQEPKESRKLQKFFTITKTDKLAFFAALLCCAFGYSYYAFNLLLNHDGIRALYWKYDHATFSSGRWAQAAQYLISPITVPWVLFLLGSVALSACVVLVVRIFSIKSNSAVIATAVALTLNPYVYCSALFNFTFDILYIAFFLSLLSIYIIEKKTAGKKQLILNVVVATVLLTVSAGVYQTFLCVPIAVFAARLLQILVSCKKTNKEVWIFTVKYAGVTLASLILYILITKFSLSLIGTELADYQNISTMGTYSKEAFFISLALVYENFLMPANYALVPKEYALYVVTLIIMALPAVLSLFFLFLNTERRTKFQNIMYLLLLIFFPILTNFVYFFDAGGTHAMMLLPFVFYFVCGIALVEELKNVDISEKRKRLFRGFTASVTGIIVCLTFFSGFRWGIYANQAAVALEVQNRNMFALCNRIVSRIETFPDFNIHTTPVYIAARNPNTELITYPATKEYFDVFGGLFAGGYDIPGISKYDYDFLNDPNVFHLYIRDHIGFNYIFDWEHGKHTQTDEFQGAPRFPQEGSLFMVDEVLVVKITEFPDWRLSTLLGEDWDEDMDFTDVAVKVDGHNH